MTVYTKNQYGMDLTVLNVSVSILAGPSPVSVVTGVASEVSTGEYSYTYTPTVEGTYSVTAYVGSTLLEASGSGVVAVVGVLGEDMVTRYVSSLSTMAGLPETVDLGVTVTGTLTLRDGLGAVDDTELPVTVQWDSEASTVGTVEWSSASDTYAVSIPAPTNISDAGVRSLEVYVDGQFLLSENVSVALLVSVDTAASGIVDMATQGVKDGSVELWVAGVTGLTGSAMGTCEEQEVVIQLLDEAESVIGTDLSDHLQAGFDGDLSLSPTWSESDICYTLSLSAPSSIGTHTLSVALQGYTLLENTLTVSQVPVPELSSVTVPSSVT
eukprot:g14464.t1